MNHPQDIATLYSHRTPIEAVPMSASFVSTLRRYFSVIVGGNLIWEFAHMPLYTLERRSGLPHDCVRLA